MFIKGYTLSFTGALTTVRAPVAVVGPVVVLMRTWLGFWRNPAQAPTRTLWHPWHGVPVIFVDVPTLATGWLLTHTNHP